MAKKNSQAPAWVWLFTGIVTGLFIAFLYHLTGVRTPAHKAEPPKKAVAQPAKPKQKYDFYTLLPDKEVVQPDSTRDKDKDKPKPNQPAGKPETFLIQTGSFRTKDEADHRRAELILLGLDVKVQQVELGDEAWHRVQLGPFDTQDKLDAARTTLRDNHIEHILVRLK